MTMVVIKTKYASIEQVFPSREEAMIYIKKSLKELEVIAYELKVW